MMLSIVSWYNVATLFQVSWITVTQSLKLSMSQWCGWKVGIGNVGVLFGH